MLGSTAAVAPMMSCMALSMVVELDQCAFAQLRGLSLPCRPAGAMLSPRAAICSGKTLSLTSSNPSLMEVDVCPVCCPHVSQVVELSVACIALRYIRLLQDDLGLTNLAAGPWPAI